MQSLHEEQMSGAVVSDLKSSPCLERSYAVLSSYKLAAWWYGEVLAFSDDYHHLLRLGDDLQPLVTSRKGTAANSKAFT